MKNIVVLILLCFFASCGEKLMEKPENLIAKDKMESILYDIAILNAAKNTNRNILKKNVTEIMDYIYSKYSIDSLQYAESNVYYASIPSEYDTIYKSVEARLLVEKTEMDLAKKIKDSLERIAKKEKQKLLKEENKKD